MPIYEYECRHCRYYLEVMQKISDAKLRKCPSCSRNALHRLISAPVFRLKGSGWYETDFKSEQENRRNLAGAERDESAAEAKAGKEAGEGKEGKDAKEATSATGATGAGAKETGAKEAKESKEGKSAREAGAAGKSAGAGTKSAAASATTRSLRKSVRPAARTPARAGKPAVRRPAARSGVRPRRGRR